MDDDQHRRHNKNLLMAHLIFVTKYRKPLLTGSFDDDVKQYIYDACLAHHWYIKRMETDKDHVHILLQYNPTDSITGIASIQKTLWSDGYFTVSIGQVSQATIENDIENQD